LWRNDIAVAREIVQLAGAHPRLEVPAHSDLSCFCLRYRPRADEPDAFNRRLLEAILRDGRMILTGTMIDRRFTLRGCVTNFRSTLEDARVCIETILELAEALDRVNDAAAARDVRRG
jgi:glutamate/tyrosine decarboxylase-like PLP-dependent enzyme